MKSRKNRKNKPPAEHQGPMFYSLKYFAALQNLVNRADFCRRKSEAVMKRTPAPPGGSIEKYCTSTVCTVAGETLLPFPHKNSLTW